MIIRKDVITWEMERPADRFNHDWVSLNKVKILKGKTIAPNRSWKIIQAETRQRLIRKY